MPESNKSWSAEEWAKIKLLFEEALSLEGPALSSFLTKWEISNPTWAKEVKALLSAHREATNFLENPALINLSSTFSENTRPSYSEGQKLSDFQIKRCLGSGSFGTVYLAKQLSLDRDVAIKLTPNRGAEAKTMAPMEHDHIVKVYAQEIVANSGERLICMQYVPGLSLFELMHQYSQATGGTRLLEALERAVPDSTGVTLDALKDRELLSGFDATSTILWLGARLARALDHAHRKGVLHLDVKPGNILLSTSGRPLLTDFNIALNFSQKVPANSPPDDSLFGGTLAYMSPEHQFAFQTNTPESRAKLDGRADVYSLGKVLLEVGSLWKMESSEATEDIGAVLRTATSADPDSRYKSAAEMAEALECCLERREIIRNFPPADALTKMSLRKPVVALFFLVLIPQCIGSIVSISYNGTQIVDRLNVSQQELFQRMVVWYNPVIYVVATSLLLWKVRHLIQFQKQPESFLAQGETFLQAFRTEVLNYPIWVAWITGTAWGISSLFFTLGIHHWRGPLPRGAFYHFYISFLLSALIALSYSFLYSQLLALRVFYPRLWRGTRGIKAKASQELRTIPRRVRFFFLLTGVIPLAAATLLVFLGPDRGGGISPNDNYSSFRLLVGLLIGAGIIGFTFALRTSDRVSQIILALIETPKSR